MHITSRYPIILYGDEVKTSRNINNSEPSNLLQILDSKGVYE